MRKKKCPPYKREDTSGYGCDRLSLPLRASLRVYAGSPISLTVSGKDGSSVSVTGDTAEQADKRPMTKDDLTKQIIKTGDSDFGFDEITVDTDDKSFVRVASVNRLRREALQLIKDKMLNGYKRSM